MADSISIKLTGFAEAADTLKNFGPRVTRNGLRSATFAAARAFRDEAKLNVQRSPLHVRTGTLLESISAFRRRTPDFQAKYAVGIRRVRGGSYTNNSLNRRRRRVGKKFLVDSPAFYGKMLERGTSKMPPKPWLRPAFDHKYAAALEVMLKGLQKAVQKAQREVAKKGAQP